jgi:hypothetical protein
MLWYVILDRDGHIKNIRPGAPHGNTQHFLTLDAERLVDAERLAPPLVAEYWAKVQAGAVQRTPARTYPTGAPRKRPGPRPKEIRCACGLPRPEEAKQCLLCEEVAHSKPMEKETSRERRDNDVLLIQLLEVQRQWQMSPNVGLFTKWLAGRIAALRVVR